MAEAEMTIKTEFNFEKRVEMFGDSVDNYTIPHELTVEITLAEYRRLLQAEAKAEANAAKADKWDREQEIRRLTKEVDALRAALRAKKEAEGPEDGEDQ
jgi:hypothetical protein